MISLEDVAVRYSDDIPVFTARADVTESPTMIVGPSGSGKSSLLRVIAGLQKPSSGRVMIGGSPVVPPSWTSAGDPRVSLIHQDYRLVPFLSLADNLRLAAEMRGLQVSDGDVEHSLARVGLESLSARRLPDTLSGGEQQRVAIARALLCRVAVLLADEPTGALDAENTVRIADLLVEVGRSDTMVLVATHDPIVAARGLRTYSMRDGILQQVATS